MSITTVVFDFGNVLGFFSHQKAAQQLAAYSPASAEAIQAYLFGGRLEDEYESNRVTTPVLMALVRETFRVSCSDEQFAAAFGDMFTPNPDVCSLIPLFKPRYRLLLLSNTNDLHSRWFLSQFADTLACFDGMVLSHKVGVRKPDPRIYAHCQRLAECPPAECLFIDDLPTNVQAARACGWQGLVYERGSDLRRALEEHGVSLSPGRRPS